MGMRSYLSPPSSTDHVLETAAAIPSESSIKAAKERRERLRKTGASTDEDYISLSMAKREDVDQGPHPESRLMREEDDLGEGDDGRFLSRLYPSPSERSTVEFAEYTSAQERIALGKKARKKATVDRREAMKELIADA